MSAVARIVELVGCLVKNPPVRCSPFRWCLNVWECIVFGAAGRWSLCANWRSHWPDSHRGPSLQATGLQDYTGPPHAHRLTLPVIHDSGFSRGAILNLAAPLHAPNICFECSQETIVNTFMISFIRREQVSDYISLTDSYQVV